MKAMILAAGRGTRMGELTAATPKPLLALAEMPLIEYHIRALAASDFRDIVINLAWLGDKITEYLGDGTRFGVNIAYSREPEGALETAGGIAHAMPLLSEEPFLVINGDVWTDFPLTTLRGLTLGDDLAHLVVVNNPQHHPAGDFAFLPEPSNDASYPMGRLSKNAEVLADETSIMTTYSGIGVYRSQAFEGITGRHALGPLLHQGVDEGRVGATHYSGHWWDVGTPQRLNEVELFLRSKNV